MARKTIWIQGSSPRQKFSDGKPTVGPTSFWHIQRPRATFRTLCGQDFDSVTESETKPGSKKDVCHFCVRIRAGRDPVFDKRTEEAYDRPSHVGGRGTIANVGEFNGATQLA